MTLQFIILWIVIFLAPLLPPILSPLGFTMTGVLVAEQANPWIVSIFTVWMTTVTAMIIRKMQNHIIEKLTIQEKIEGDTLFIKIVNRINKYFKNQERIGKISLKWEKYIETRSGRIATFFFAIFCYLPVLPDIVGTRLLYKKIRFPYFIGAVIIGKSISHIPFIFVWKTIIQLVWVRMS